MKKSLVFLLFIAAVLTGCDTRSENFRIPKGAPAYQLAKELAKVFPELDPSVDTVLVSSDSFTVTAGEVIQALSDQAGDKALRLKEIDPVKLRDFIFHNAVQIGERKLLLKAAAAVETTISDEEFDEILYRQYAQAGGKLAFHQNLVEAGLNSEIIMKTLRENLLIKKYLDSIMDTEIRITEADLLEAYNSDKTASVRHILIMTQEKSEDEKAEALKKMEALLTRARNGEDFAALASEFSEDPGSNDKGGLYENFGRGVMVEPFEDAAFSVPVGEISDIIKTSYGYHILKVESRQKETRPFEEVREELEAQIRQIKEEDVFKIVIRNLKESAGFKTNPLKKPEIPS